MGSVGSTAYVILHYSARARCGNFHFPSSVQESAAVRCLKQAWNGEFGNLKDLRSRESRHSATNTSDNRARRAKMRNDKRRGGNQLDRLTSHYPLPQDLYLSAYDVDRSWRLITTLMHTSFFAEYPGESMSRVLVCLSMYVMQGLELFSRISVVTR